MKRFFQILLFMAAGVLTAPGCSFFTSPDEARFGDLQINIHFAGTTNSGKVAKSGMLASPQAIDRLVVIVFEYSFQDTRNNGSFERELLRREFHLGTERQLQTVIQVPLENAELSCFRVAVRAFQGDLLLYTGEDPNVCFDEENNRSTQANVLLDPTAFSINGLAPTNNPRVYTLTGQVQDTSVTRVAIEMADSLVVTLPISGISFSNPVILFGNNSRLRVSAFRGTEFISTASRQITYTGRPADVLVALVWNEPVDLDLQIQNPLQQIISSTARGDSVGGSGLLLLSDDGYGPEVFEWRRSRIPGGPFTVQVARLRTQVLQPASGKVFIFFREGEAQQRILSFPFEFKPGDTQLFQNIYNFTWL